MQTPCNPSRLAILSVYCKNAIKAVSMQHRRNYSLWVGFLLVLAGLVSYIPFFALFPITRDFPWANLLLLSAGGVLLWLGLRHAFRQPELYRGKIFGSILAVLSAIGIGLFVYGIFYELR